MIQFRTLLFIMALIVTSHIPVEAKPVRKIKWTPAMISVYPDKLMLPRARNVYGLELSLGQSGAERVRGFQIAAFKAKSREVTGFQIGTVWAESQKVDGLQIAFFPLTGQRLRGGQIGFVNNMKFEGDAPLRVKGFQISAMNSAESMGGLQIGVINTATRFRGVQLGVANHSVNARGIQIGGANFNGLDDDPGRVARGFHLGFVNFTQQGFQGVQIGLLNGVDRLNGVQIGLLNYVRNPRRNGFRLLPLLRIGW